MLCKHISLKDKTILSWNGHLIFRSYESLGENLIFEFFIIVHMI